MYVYTFLIRILLKKTFLLFQFLYSKVKNFIIFILRIYYNMNNIYMIVTENVFYVTFSFFYYLTEPYLQLLLEKHVKNVFYLRRREQNFL